MPVFGDADSRGEAPQFIEVFRKDVDPTSAGIPEAVPGRVCVLVDLPRDDGRLLLPEDGGFQLLLSVGPRHFRAKD